MIRREDLLGVFANGFAIEIREDHFDLGHAEGLVGNILQIRGDHVDLLAGEVFAGRDAEVRELRTILDF